MPQLEQVEFFISQLFWLGVFFVILFTVLSISCQMNTNSDKKKKKIWFTDVSQAIEQSKVSGKPIL